MGDEVIVAIVSAIASGFGSVLLFKANTRAKKIEDGEDDKLLEKFLLDELMLSREEVKVLSKVNDRLIAQLEKLDTLSLDSASEDKLSGHDGKR